MLPGLRLILGGLAAALMALLMGFGLTATTRFFVTPAAALPARGALIEPAGHPEWRQFLVLAALRRADELNRLNDLPGGVPRNKAGGARLVNFPGGRIDSAPDDETGSTTETPSVTIPIDIGETSSTELPVARGKEATRVPPERAKPEVANPDKSIRKIRARRIKPSAGAATPNNPFSLLFSVPAAN